LGFVCNDLEAAGALAEKVDVRMITERRGDVLQRRDLEEEVEALAYEVPSRQLLAIPS
jgi:hypothetical protein